MQNDRPHRVTAETLSSFAEQLGCTEEVLQHCLARVGNSPAAIESYWEMNRERLQVQVDGEAIPTPKRRA